MINMEPVPPLWLCLWWERTFELIKEEQQPAGRLPVAASWPPPSFSTPSSLASSSSSSSSSATAAVKPGVSCIHEEIPPPRHLPRHDGPRAINCVDVLILRCFSYQIWIMHLIFLATLLVSILLLWLHPSLASLGRYCHSLLAFLSL